MIDTNCVNNDPNRCTMYFVTKYENFGGQINFNIGSFCFMNGCVEFITSSLSSLKSIHRLLLISGLEYNDNYKTNWNEIIYVYLKSKSDFDKLISIVQICINNKVQIEGRDKVEEFFNA